MVTETDEVGAALDRVREADPDQSVNLAELVVLGAARKVEMVERARSDDRRRSELRERFLQRTRTGEGVDWDALLAVHERGWTHAPDD
jgi:DNA polymerase IIIc chi subunit